MVDEKDIITWLGIFYLLYGVLSFNQRFIYRFIYVSTISMQQYFLYEKYHETNSFEKSRHLYLQWNTNKEFCLKIHAKNSRLPVTTPAK